MRRYDDAIAVTLYDAEVATKHHLSQCFSSKFLLGLVQHSKPMLSIFSKGSCDLKGTNW